MALPETTLTDIDLVLSNLRKECPALEWDNVAGTARFWDAEDWLWIKNPYKAGVESVDPTKRFPGLTEEGVKQMVGYNLR